MKTIKKFFKELFYDSNIPTLTKKEITRRMYL